MTNQVGTEPSLEIQILEKIAGIQQMKTENLSIAFGTTQFIGIGSGIEQAVEADSQVKMGRAGKIKKMIVNIIGTNTLDAATTVDVRKNGVSAPTTANIPNADSNDVEVNIETVFKKDDLLNIRAVVAGAAGVMVCNVTLIIEWGDF